MMCQLGLQVRSLVLVDNVTLGQLIHHRGYFGIKIGSLLLVGRIPEFLDRITRGPGIITVVQPSFFGLPDPFQC